MRITFAAVPAYGHVFPMAPLAEAAAVAGHDVVFAASDDFADRLPVPVLQGVPEGLGIDEATVEAKAELTDREDPFAWPKAMFGVVMPRHTRPRLLAHWEAAGLPDLVVHEALNAGAAQAAAEAGVPAVAFSIGLAPAEMFLGMLLPMVGAPLGPVLDPVPPTWRGNGASTLDRIPIRSVAWSDATAAPPTWPPGDGPAVYLTLGTVSFGAVDVLRRSVLETAARCGRVLVAAGPDGDPAALGELPDNVRVERYVDQARVIEESDVVVHHGGTGTVLACLAAGVPQLVTPQGADQFMNGDRLAELGLGRVVQNDADAGEVGAAVGALLADAGVCRRVGAVRDEIAAMPAPAEAVDELERRWG
jgi:hypothetical protein